MQIQSGKLYENRTWKYLYPCLKHYGSDLMNKLSSFFKLAVGVGDSNRTEDSSCIYILIDTDLPLATERQRQAYKEAFATFLDWVSYQDYYVSDYIYEKNQHMIVLKLPEKFSASYVSFVKGHYSEMYNLAERKDYFRYVNLKSKELELKQNNKLKATRSVLEKDKSYVQTFVDRVNQDFNTSVSAKHFMEAELDYPPKKEEEIFNYKEEKAV